MSSFKYASPEKRLFIKVYVFDKIEDMALDSTIYKKNLSVGDFSFLMTYLRPLLDK